MSLLIQISSGNGPFECQIFVKKAMTYFIKEAQSKGLEVEILEERQGQSEGKGLKSSLLKIKDSNAYFLLNRMEGTWKWIYQNPSRKKGSRKNWFIQVLFFLFEEKNVKNFSSSEIEIKFIKSRGPGGQNVNKVCSGVWIKHFNSNISVRYDTERTQKRNKECALKLLEYKLNILVFMAHLNEYETDI